MPDVSWNNEWINEMNYSGNISSKTVDWNGGKKRIDIYVVWFFKWYREILTVKGSLGKVKNSSL